MSILNVNKINPVGGGSTITIAGIASVTSSVTAPSFVGAVTGNVTGNADTASGLSGNPSINTTGIVTATAFVPTTGQLSHRNIIINGDMRVAQRGVTSTSSGYYTVDRFKVTNTGTDESPTQAQVDVASGTTPYTSGFRKALKVTNGNQTSGAGGGDFIWIQHVIEAQNIATSGWNYTSSSSNITLSFWVKSSVAQDFKGYLRSSDGTNLEYPFATGSLSADTWTKITKTIPGNSNLQFDNDNDYGLEINILPFLGTDRTDGGLTEDAWTTYSSSARTKDHTSTWYTTNDATFEITGVQLEVGSVETPFEHRSFGDELLRCQRYCVAYGGDDEVHLGTAHAYNSTNINLSVHLPVPMRVKPSASTVTSGGNWVQAYMGASGNTSNASISVGDSGGTCKDITAFRLYLSSAHSGLSAGQALWVHTIANAKLILSAEL